MQLLVVSRDCKEFVIVVIRRGANKECGGRVPVLSIVTSTTMHEGVPLATELDVHELVFVLWKGTRARWRSMKIRGQKFLVRSKIRGQTELALYGMSEP
jgi:predicted polyphosphate/ATP-dependent NAD kinase